MSIKSSSLVTLPLPGFQWGSCTIFSYQDVNQILLTLHPPPSWVLVRFVCQSNRIHSTPSPFLGFSEVRARSLVIRVIMSIKSYSLVTLPLPGFQWGSCTIFSHQDVNQIVFTRHPPPSWVLVRFVHDLQLLGLLCQSNRLHSPPPPFLGFSGVRARSLVIRMLIKSSSLVTLPLPGFQWGSCTIFSYQGYYVNQIVFTRHLPPSWVLVGFVHDLQLLGCQSNRLHSSPSSFLGFTDVRARSLVIRVITSIKPYSLVTLPLPGFQWGSCTIFSYQDYYVNQIVFTRHPPPSWVLVGFVNDLQLLGLLCQSNRLHSSTSSFLGFSGVRARSLVIRVIMSIKSYSLVTLPLPGFQWGSCTIFSYQDVNQILLTLHPPPFWVLVRFVCQSNRIHSTPSPFLGFSEVRARSLVIRVIMSIKSSSLVTLPLPGFQWGSCTIFSHQDVNQIVFTRHPPPSWVLVRFLHDLQLLGLLCQSNRIHSSPSPFLGFSEVRARSLVIRVIMSIKSYSLVTLLLPGFQ